MYKYFDTEFFVSNRKRLRELFVGTAPIVITANGVMQRTGDTTYPFRQDSSFWYLTGINDPDVILVIDKNKEYLIVPASNDYQDAFDGAPNLDELRAVSGIQTIHDQKEGWRLLGNRLNKTKHAATLSAPKSYVEPYGFYANPARARLISRLKEINPQLDLLDLRPHLLRLRVVKQPAELAALQQAIDITIKAFKNVRTHTYQYEYQVETSITATFRRNGAFTHGYSPIIAGGARSCILHYGANQALLDAKELLLIDAGAEVENYTADISRTFAQSIPTKRQKDVYQAVLAVYDYALRLLKPGVSIRQNEKLIEQFMGEKLRELGLIKIIDHENVRKFYPHATSHFLGLDAHDPGDYDRPLEANMVLTIEPGIYIPQESIGIRIEDDVLITTDGYTVMSQKLSRDSL